MQPIPQCLGDAKPYLEGAGSFKLIGDASNSTTGGSGSGSGNNTTAGGSTSKNSAVAVSGSVALTSVAGIAAIAVALF